MTIDSNVIAELTIRAEKKYLSLAQNFVHELLQDFSLEEKKRTKLEIAVEEAVVNVIDHAYDPGENGICVLDVSHRPGEVAVGIRDEGLPFDFEGAQSGRSGSLGIVLMKGLADEIRFTRLGHGGKKIELAARLPYRDISSYPAEPEQPAIDPDTPLSMRIMTAADAVAMSRCVYRSYGYSYGHDFVYFPTRVREMIEKGLLHSVIAVTPDGRIAGHLAMVLDTPDAKVGESGMAVVDPAFRGRGLFKKMKLFLRDYALQRGMYGLYSEAVAVHPYTQKGNLSLGAHQTGLLLGMIPMTMHFRNIQQEEADRRQSCVFYYMKVQNGPVRTAWVPPQHRAIVRKIYDSNGIERNFMEKAPAKEDTGTTGVSVSMLPDLGIAAMKIVDYGSDTEEVVRQHLRRLCIQRFDCIYIDLPLGEAGTMRWCAAIEMMGFFFAGVIPEMYNGDVLRLQYLNNVEVDPSEVVIVSDFSKELLEYVSRGLEGLS